MPYHRSLNELTGRTQINKPILEALFGRGAKAKVIEWLYVQKPDIATLSARALAKEAGVAYGSIHKTLTELVNAQLVVREGTARGPEYRVPSEDPRLTHLFLLLRQDSQIVELLKRALKPFKAIELACIFGSFAQGTTRKDSDLDVLVLEKTDLDRFLVMAELSKVSAKIHREVNPEFYTKAEFEEKILRGDPIALNVLTNPRISLKGDATWPN